MKPALVSVLLTVLAACELPTEPPPKLPRLPDQNGPVVITGRIIQSNTRLPLQAANVRVMEAAASVGTDQMGRYRIVLPGKFRGREVPLLVRAIGFKARDRAIMLTSDSTIVDFGLEVMALRFDCVMSISASNNGAYTGPAAAVTTSSAPSGGTRPRVGASVKKTTRRSAR